MTVAELIERLQFETPFPDLTIVKVWVPAARDDFDDVVETKAYSVVDVERDSSVIYLGLE